MTNFGDEYLKRKPDMSFDYKNCSGYEPVEHHRGLCWTGDTSDTDCDKCPVHTDFALWVLGEGVECIDLSIEC